MLCLLSVRTQLEKKHNGLVIENENLRSQLRRQNEETEAQRKQIEEAQVAFFLKYSEVAQGGRRDSSWSCLPDWTKCSLSFVRLRNFVHQSVYRQITQLQIELKTVDAENVALRNSLEEQNT